MASVDVKNVYKSYGNIEIIHNINVHISDQEFMVLVGPSGCGKSTLLRMIAGLEQITSGDICINNKIVNDVPPKSRNIAMVFQNYALYPHMNVYDNMAFSLKIAKTDKKEIEERVKKAAEILNLSEYLDRYPRQLSGGQRQRVAMGRAIVRDPMVFLFDEPLSNLDAKLRVQMRAEIKALHQRLRVTSVYVTHDQIEAMTMADKIVVMESGNIEQIGAPLELYDQPANLFVAGFIGSPAMNFINGTVRRSSDTVQIIGKEGLSVTLGADTPGEDGQPVVFGTRPEHLTLAEEGHGIPTKVNVIEPTGSETLMIGEISSETSIQAAFRERHDISPGQKIYLRPDLNHKHLFDAKSGLRLNA